MKHRLCLTELAGAGTPAERLELDRDQSHYLHRVLRLRNNAELAVFDGGGREWHARLIVSGPRQCELAIDKLVRVEPAPTPLVLCQSWLKGSAMDTVVQKAVELGANRIRLLNAERSNVKLDRKRLDNKLAHLHRVARSAAEQSGAVWLPGLSQVDNLSALLGQSEGLSTIVLDLEKNALSVAPAPVPLQLVVGPEGGWSDSERTLISSDGQVLSMGLGQTTLRAETVPLAALAAVRHSWGWQG